MILPPTVPGNDCVRMDAWNDRIWLAAGGIDGAGVPLYRQEGFSGRKGSWWRTIAPPSGEAGGAGVQDVMDVSIHPLTPELATFGSLEEGLIDIRETEVEAYWNPSNSPLEWNANWQDPRCAVPALDYDRLGNLWLINEGTETPLHLRDAEGGWHVFELEGLDASTRFWKVLATQADQVWMVLGAGEGVAVLSTGGTPSDPSDDDFRILGQGDGGLPSGFVYAVEEDLDGEIWLGTLQGPAVFYQPSGLFGPTPLTPSKFSLSRTAISSCSSKPKSSRTSRWTGATGSGWRRSTAGFSWCLPMAASRWRISRRRTVRCPPMRCTTSPSTSLLGPFTSPPPMG